MIDLKNIIENKVFKSSLEAINFKEHRIINTINPHSFCEARKDSVFEAALMKSDVLLPDGSGIVLATKVLTKQRIQKIAGADIHDFLLKKADRNNEKVFYLGASQHTLDLIASRIKKDYPNIQFGCYSPPYKPIFSELDSKEMIRKVNDFNPTYLFVGMTAPKQEKWVYQFQKRLHTEVIVSIGAVFDFYAGTVERSSAFWINLGLEWLPRLIKEPKRLWKRNFVSTPLFLWYLMKAKIR